MEASRCLRIFSWNLYIVQLRVPIIYQKKNGIHNQTFTFSKHINIFSPFLKISSFSIKHVFFLWILPASKLKVLYVSEIQRIPNNRPTYSVIHPPFTFLTHQYAQLHFLDANLRAKKYNRTRKNQHCICLS